MKNIPDWLKVLLDTTSYEQGKYSFELDGVTLPDLPKGFTGIASSDDGGLAVSSSNDGVIYRFENKQIDVYAVNESEFDVSLRRDAAWEELAENMPALQSYWLGIVLKTKRDDGSVFTLGFKGELHNSAMVLQGQVNTGEMLVDTLDRELLKTLELDDYTVLDLYDEGDVMELKNKQEPLFTVTVLVPMFDPQQKLKEVTVDWLDMEKKRIVN